MCVSVLAVSRGVRALFSALRALLLLTLSGLGILLLTFLVGKAVPVDPALVLLGDLASEEAYQRTRIELGLDEPLVVQFLTHCFRIFSGDLGVSTLTGNPVAQDLAHLFPATLELATLSLLFGAFPGLLLGVLAAARPQGKIDTFVRVLSFLGHSFPIFWLGPVALFFFYGYLGWVGGPGRLDLSFGDFPAGGTGLLLLDSLLLGDLSLFLHIWSHIVLPALLLGCFAFAHIARMTRIFLTRELSRCYISSLRARGIPERQILWKHAWHNARGQVLSMMIWCYAHLLEGSVLTETIFSWPGVGRYVAQALHGGDMQALLGSMVVTGSVFLLLIFFADRLSAFLGRHNLEERN